MRHLWRSRWVVLFCMFAVRLPALTGIDTGLAAPEASERLPAWMNGPKTNGRWLRIRNLADEGDSPGIAKTRDALKKMRARGFRVCVLLMPDGSRWAHGTRSHASANLPVDLREAYQWVLHLDAAYGDVVDAWEIDNEPDIGFATENAENYAGFLKVCFLGLKTASATRAGEAGTNGDATAWKLPFPRPRSSTAGGSPLVLMAPLALPPGPYWLALVRNGILSYTDGLNYHYYGYADDFSGVYRQFEDSIADTNSAPLVGNAVDSRQLPIFLTEIGYGMLGKTGSLTTQGRVRQWEWFRSIEAQITTARIEGPMAFLLFPYFENGLNEFGLSQNPINSVPGGQRNDGFYSGGVSFRPGNFHETVFRSWMSFVGERVGRAEASPALAYVVDYDEKHQYAPRSWIVQGAPPSHIVVDFLAGQDMRPIKSSQGYCLGGRAQHSYTGVGELRIYNFSDHALAGHLVCTGGVSATLGPSGGSVLTLGPQEMRALPAHLAISRDPWRGEDWNIDFVPEMPEEGVSHFSTRLYPDAAEFRRVVAADLNRPASEAAHQRKALLAMPLAEEEPALQPDGRWLVTEGVSVHEEGGVWRFEIDHPPDTALRPAVAELPLPDGFLPPQDSFLALSFRCQSAGKTPCRYGGLSTAEGGLVQVQIRTENGNLYEVWPRRMPTEHWQDYEEPLSNFTMSFFGRANLPWRFKDNRPAAVVLTFWPRTLPTMIEVRPSGFVRLE